MSQLTIAKLALSIAGLVVWWYGNQAGNRVLTWVGIGLLAMAVVLRFLGRAGRQ